MKRNMMNLMAREEDAKDRGSTEVLEAAQLPTGICSRMSLYASGKVTINYPEQLKGEMTEVNYHVAQESCSAVGMLVVFTPRRRAADFESSEKQHEGTAGVSPPSDIAGTPSQVLCSICLDGRRLTAATLSAEQLLADELSVESAAVGLSRPRPSGHLQSIEPSSFSSACWALRFPCSSETLQQPDAPTPADRRPSGGGSSKGCP
ncbi:hypothetical protein Efla_007076 [Eimeria flavescens]